MCQKEAPSLAGTIERTLIQQDGCAVKRREKYTDATPDFQFSKKTWVETRSSFDILVLTVVLRVRLNADSRVFFARDNRISQEDNT